MGVDGTFPALEQLKQEADGVNVLITIAPDWIEPGIEWLFDIEYLARKKDLLAERERYREEYRSGCQRIENTYGSTIVRILERRSSREQPQFNLKRAHDNVNDAKKAIDNLYDDLDLDFLTYPEQRKLSALQEDIVSAREYVRNKREFERVKREVSKTVSEFEHRFEPYAGSQQYMTTTDHEYLMRTANEICRRLTDAARELELLVLPDDDVDWLSETKTRFETLSDMLPDYNDEFVKRERERYASLFETEHGPLNPRQQKAIVRNDRRNLVDASAGTGKTLTLTYRFLYLVEKGVSPTDIAAITYTRDAAAEMANRIADAIGGVDPEDLHISTIHSFAGGIVNQTIDDRPTEDREIGEVRDMLVEQFMTAYETGRDTEYAILFPDRFKAFAEAFDAFETLDAEKEYSDSHADWGESTQEFYRRKLDEFIENARTFDLSPAKIRARLTGTHAIRDAFGEAGAILLDTYLEIVNSEAQPTDFEDMIQSASRLVQGHPDEFADRYRHILVDEFQDVSDVELTFIESFMGGESDTRLFCVGDDWQSIYGFNGSNVRHFTEYDRQFDDVTYTQLAVNYRCPPIVVDAGANLIAQSAAPQNEKTVRAHSSVNATPQLHLLEELYEQPVVAHAIDLVEAALADGRSYDDVMILSRNDRNSSYMIELRKQLKAREIPHRRPKGKRDYLPDSYRDSLEYPIEFDGQKNAVYANEPEVPESLQGETPPLVLSQSIHASKGTEAPVVILLHAADDDPDGIPIKERSDQLLEPAVDITADRIAEERRLFYVALTRTEEEFHALAPADNVSRYIEDIDHYFETRRSETVVVGECTSYSPPSPDSNRPIKATLDCGDYEAQLVAWPDNDPPELEVGATYEIRDLEIETKFGEEIRFDRSTVSRVQSAR